MESSHYGKLKIGLRYDPEISLLGIYSEKNMIQKDTCTSVFTEALFTIAKTWKLNRGVDKEDVLHIFSGILLSH